MKEIIAALLFNATLDMKKFSPALRNFIYSQVGADRLPIGEILERALCNEKDAAEIDAILKKIKALAPDALETLPPMERMLFQPLIKYLTREDK
jgi:hypothetical protein